jgi:hypothetical protein
MPGTSSRIGRNRPLAKRLVLATRPQRAQARMAGGTEDKIGRKINSWRALDADCSALVAGSAASRNPADQAKHAMFGGQVEAIIGTECVMVDETGKRERKDSRQDRLKFALRENLKRRKAQARERSQTTEPSSTADETSINGQACERER